MNSKKEYDDIFDDNFEVTYEEDFIADYKKEFDDHTDSDRDSSPETKREKIRKSMPVSHSYSSKRKRGVPLAAPIRKGGRTLSRLASSLLRSLTAILIAATAVYAGWTFWRASTPYGDITEMIRTQKPDITLLCYLCSAVLFLLFEMVSFFWSLTKVRVRNGIDSWKEDTGRGLISFIIVFAASYLAFLLSPFIPESPAAVYGIKGALNVFGSMHNVLSGLCTAGVISCIVRRFFC